MKEYKNLKYTDDYFTCLGPAAEDIKIAVFHPLTKYIENNAFENYKSLEEIDIDSRLESIGQEAFFGCENLKVVKIKSDVCTILEREAFGGTNIEIFKIGQMDYFSNSLPGGFEYNIKSFQMEVTGDIPFELFFIEEDGRKSNLEEVIIVKDDGKKIDENFIFDKDGEDILCAYPQGRKDTIVTLPSNTKKIEGGAFKNNPFIKEVYIGENLEMIDNIPFCCNENLEYIYLKSKNVRLKDTLCEKCKNLKAIYLHPQAYEKNKDRINFFLNKNLYIPCSMEKLLDSGKSFKDANKIYKDFAR